MLDGISSERSTQQIMGISGYLGYARQIILSRFYAHKIQIKEEISRKRQKIVATIR